MRPWTLLPPCLLLQGCVLKWKDVPALGHVFHDRFSRLAVWAPTLALSRQCGGGLQMSGVWRPC